MRVKLTVFSSAIFFAAALLNAQSAEDIVRKMDDMQTFESLYAEGTLINIDRFGEKISTYKSWSQGSKDFLIEFTNVEERGQKILRVDDELYLFYPEAEDIIPMHGAALKKSMFGDISYEDITEGRNTLSKYEVSMQGSEVVDGIDCWVIMMMAKSRHVPYAKQVIKVGKEDTVLREAEYYARSGRLLKIVNVVKVENFSGGRVLATELLLVDQLRRGSSTRMLIDNVEVEPQLERNLFSLQSLY